MDIHIEVDSPACPTTLRISIADRVFFYRERHYRWTVDEVVPDWHDQRTLKQLDSGNASIGDGYIEGITRTLKACNFAFLLSEIESDG